MVDFLTWSEKKHVTKELAVDLRGTKALATTTNIKGVSVEVLEQYSYLGVYSDHKLD